MNTLSIRREPALTLANWSSLNFRLRWAYSGTVPTDYRHGEVDHTESCLVWFVETGLITVDTRDRHWEVGPGQGFVAPREKFTQHVADHTRLLSVNVRCQWPSGKNLFAQSAAEYLDPKDHPELERRSRALVRIADKHMPGIGAALEFHPVSHRLFLLFQRETMAWMETFISVMLSRGWTYAHNQVTDPRLSAILRLLDHHSGGVEALWNDIRRLTRLDRATANHLFESAFTLTIPAYWNMCRLRLAQNILAAEEIPVKELSHRLGFSQQSHFTRWFKGRTGVAPREYRIRMKPRHTGNPAEPRHVTPPSPPASPLRASNR